MFALACTQARKFTRPVIVSHVQTDGKCGAGVGAYVVINEDGWFVTADHILSMIGEMSTTCKAVQTYNAFVAAVEGDPKLTAKERQRKIASMKKPPKEAPMDFSPYWGASLEVEAVHSLPDVDLAVGKFKKFDGASVASYPIFKDPSQPIDQGISLCKLGYPFYEVTPKYTKGKGFELPPGSVPLPCFPIDGIFTRNVNVVTTGPARTYPLKFLETSSPGLRGQSGGPTFDAKGTVFAIQSRTQHFPLGFDTHHGQGKKRTLVPQFLNVGWGVHVATVVGFLEELGVGFRKSDY
jgi:hypothetical protein